MFQLLDITEMPVGAKEARKRKRQQGGQFYSLYIMQSWGKYTNINSLLSLLQNLNLKVKSQAHMVFLILGMCVAI